MKRVLIKLTGTVQGVGCRHATLTKARALGVTGYVTNCVDGSVEVLAQGSNPAVDNLIAWCELGVPCTDGLMVRVEEDQGDDIYLDFSIVR
ncbi:MULTISPECIES: acylphosphatase [Shewanella]|uniref:acylphosphatase n=1 Tax=Shewanella xiamenensis TaxID=332186 RepID=A0A1E3V011_9GAMM|nr:MULTISPECIES: acylphosphatase [Shewanella]MCH7423027.1 acylphosphatase [Shewanella sp. MM_2022_3]MCT8868164.1 acylphosphatase [Shewanella xiamenensis]MDG5899990.1 acylphosphatase [Shewanella xiamenensis]MDI5833786.1 acylphosphatase [Shewanella xiamenensis]MDI5835856.1 acylphosphatase [Shewanella xiamenensis]